MALEYKGQKQKRQHIELIWQEHLRTDFESKQFALILKKRSRDLAGARLIDTELGTALIALPSKRLYAQRWESEAEAKSSSALNKHYTTTLAKTISKSREKRAKLKGLVKSITEALSQYPEIQQIVTNLDNEAHIPKSLNFDTGVYFRKKFGDSSASHELGSSMPARKVEQPRSGHQPIVTKSSNYFLVFLGLIAATVALLIMVGKGCI